MKKIIISVSNDIVTDQRVIRVAGTLIRNGYEVLIVGRVLPGTIEMGTFPYVIHRFSMCFKKGPLFYFFLNLRLFFFLLFRKVDILLANDLDTLSANFLVAKLKRIPLVYDSHEYFTEVPELVDRKIIKHIWLFIESSIVPKLKYIYTVNQSIADIYIKKYHVDVKVIRNLPECNNEEFPKVDIPGILTRKIILYQGALNMARGIDLAIRAMTHLKYAILVIAGDGPERKTLEELTEFLDLNGNVIFLGRKLPAELVGITAQADLGISFEQKVGLNYYYALPNKIFDYIHAEIPVLVSPFPEMEKLVNYYGVGEVVNSYDPKSIATQMNSMIQDQEKRKLWKEKLIKAANELCWNKEEKSLIELFDNIK